MPQSFGPGGERQFDSILGGQQYVARQQRHSVTSSRRAEGDASLLPDSGQHVQAASELNKGFISHERPGSSRSSSSADSMHGRPNNLTPESESSEGQRESRGSSPVAAKISRLRLKTETPPAPEPPTYDVGTLSQDNLDQGANKRTAPEQLTGPCQKASACSHPSYGPNYGRRSAAPTRKSGLMNGQAVKHTLKSKPNPARSSANCCKLPSLSQTFRDSAYESMDRSSVQQNVPAMKKTFSNIAQQCQEPVSDPNLLILQRKGLLPQPTNKDRWPGIRSQPESSPISQEQLAAEVKGIYAGLVMVEAKCINIDGQKAANPDERLGAEQWQALIALHRTLLYEHHDFLMATQHPAANAALRGLATKYCMPARMWKHGIHAFLEVLRHRRPESQEYMLAFIYLAYQMMALLYETVSGFTDTWIECLGDLARYRMAIEEDKEAHATWGGVAGRWYTMASDRHPAVGRLYHHLGILQRPSLCKLFYYARSLTSVIPFLNAKESLATLCAPILNDEQALRNGNHSAEAMSICFHARVFSNQSENLIKRDGKAALTLLRDQPNSKIAAYGVYLAVTSIAAVLGFGPADNVYRQLYDQALNHEIQASRSAAPATHPLKSKFILTTSLDLTNSASPLDFVLTFLYSSFNTIVRRQPTKDNVQDLLPFVHVMLVYIASIHTLRSRLAFNDPNRHMLDHLVDRTRLDWSALVQFLNTVASFYPMTSRIELFARQGMFPAGGAPLHEDYLIRGLVWAQWYFAPDWFQGLEDDDGSRSLENPMRQTARAERTLWLGLRLAMQTDCLQYNDTKKRFFTSAEGVQLPEEIDEASPKTTSESLSVGGDFVVVQKPSPSPSPPREHPRASQSNKTYASIVSGTVVNTESRANQQQSQQQSRSKKVLRAEANVKIHGEDSMDVE